MNLLLAGIMFGHSMGIPYLSCLLEAQEAMRIGALEGSTYISRGMFAFSTIEGGLTTVVWGWITRPEAEPTCSCGRRWEFSQRGLPVVFKLEPQQSSKASPQVDKLWYIQ